jgi:hypothetical protein
MNKFLSVYLPKDSQNVDPVLSQLNPVYILRLYFYYIRFNTLKTECFLDNIYKSSSYLTGNTLRLCYKVQPINAV